jgi:hypothetical protein
MFELVTAVILYVFGFLFLYGVIRLGVRHAFEDLEARRAGVQRAREAADAHDWRFLHENAFLTRH